MAIVSGLVEKVNERTTAYGPMFSAMVNGEWYTLGKTASGVANGDSIEFVAEQNAKGYWSVQKGSIKPFARKATAPLEGAKTGPTPVYGDARQDSIIFQSSRNIASQLVIAMVEQGMIDFGKAKFADKQAIVEAHVDKLTTHMYEEAKQNKTFPSQSVTLDETRATKVAADSGDDELPY